eukprot:CAMPEP_0114232816 /NCGR_PEP_ID=MMETSP0058-20121206/4820_1 /TAXON_ID=36894 /ORGANISM="Pyramimonas parkeae, CCMP726" /LENGTH=203 /DNA_ID=CAMNT_0001344339 /DNA_START=260 /DNA_END=871 /DNA_ORIENTATION=-
MDLVPTADLRQDVQTLTTLDDGAVMQFASIALEILRKGPTATKGFASAAKKLGTSVDSIQTMCKALCHALLEAARSEPSEAALGEYFHELGFTGDSRQALVQFYADNHKEIRELGLATNLEYAHYKSIEWRLDVQVASRSLRREATPSFLLNVVTETPDGKQESCTFEADYETMLNWHQQAEQALKAATSTDTRRLMRHVRIH